MEEKLDALIAELLRLMVEEERPDCEEQKRMHDRIFPSNGKEDENG